MNNKNQMTIGWQEWVSLPELKIPAIKSKIDTGAKTSSLHAFDIRHYTRNKIDFVRFKVHPIQFNNSLVIRCHAPIIDVRGVMSSNAHIEKRFVINSTLNLGDLSWNIELTLSNRDPLRFRMLLGREALKSGILINPSKTLCTQKLSKVHLRKLYSANK